MKTSVVTETEHCASGVSSPNMSREYNNETEVVIKKEQCWKEEQLYPGSHDSQDRDDKEKCQAGFSCEEFNSRSQNGDPKPSLIH